MATKRTLKPVQIFGIEFDALIDETKTLNSSIPSYPTENGYNVSDTIINEPLSVSMTLYVTCTPVTWLKKHGHSNTRVKTVCDNLEKKWKEKKLTKITTSDTVYTNMGITSINIKKSSDSGYAREISITAQKIIVTSKKTTKIPAYSLKSGTTKAKAGKASTSKTSKKSTKKKTTTKKTTSSKAKKVTKKSTSNKSKNSSKNSGSKKKASILYGIAKKLF